MQSESDSIYYDLFFCIFLSFKAYCIDPSFMSDSDHISKLLVTLEPLASSLHFCIIGSYLTAQTSDLQPLPYVLNDLHSAI